MQDVSFVNVLLHKEKEKCFQNAVESLSVGNVNAEKEPTNAVVPTAFHSVSAIVDFEKCSCTHCKCVNACIQKCKEDLVLNMSFHCRLCFSGVCCNHVSAVESFFVLHFMSESTELNAFSASVQQQRVWEAFSERETLPEQWVSLSKRQRHKTGFFCQRQFCLDLLGRSCKNVFSGRSFPDLR